jgi:zinc-binding in reverse transcriptase
LEPRKEKGELLAFLTSLQLDSSIFDTVFWCLLSTSIFTVHSIYLFLNFRGIRTSLVGSVWKLSILFKIKFFIWLDFQAKILTRDVLLQRWWTVSASCVFCTYLESFDHLFFTL